jgi:hypothetical protein
MTRSVLTPGGLVVFWLCFALLLALAAQLGLHVNRSFLGPRLAVCPAFSCPKAFVLFGSGTGGLCEALDGTALCRSALGTARLAACW